MSKESGSELPFRADVLPGPGPVVHPEIEGFWSALEAGHFVLPRCEDCGTIRFPVVGACWRCLSRQYTWEPVTASGTVAVAITLFRATGRQDLAPAVPYLTGLVDLDGGPRLPGRILCRCGDGAHRGARVEMVRVPTNDDRVVFAFEHGCESTPG
jgi:uncharacterized OB-fold protein